MSYNIFTTSSDCLFTETLIREVAFFINCKYIITFEQINSHKRNVNINNYNQF